VPGAVGVVHGAARAQFAPAHAQRIIAITGNGDQGLRVDDGWESAKNTSLYEQHCEVAGFVRVDWPQERGMQTSQRYMLTIHDLFATTDGGICGAETEVAILDGGVEIQSLGLQAKDWRNPWIKARGYYLKVFRRY
jgi:hypothetical protein